jgi:hypothetical protein
MPDLMNTTPIPLTEGVQSDVSAIRAAMIGDRITITQAAAAFDVTERSIYSAIEQHKIPYVKVFGVRYMAPADLRHALVLGSNTAPRGRGRPRKAA